MNANTPWLAAHGRLWYDDKWYRVAWIIWPQAAGLLIFVVLWLNYPAAQGLVPWARPVLEATKNPAVAQQQQPPQQQQQQYPIQQPQTLVPQTQQPQASTEDALALCKGEDWG